MDVGSTNGWRMNEVMPSADVLNLLKTELKLTALAPAQQGETAERWGYVNSEGQHDPLLGEIGFISSVSNAFCRDCNRARLTTEGQMYLCLFASQGYDLKPLIRNTQNEDELVQAIASIWSGRGDRYSELRQQEKNQATDASIDPKSAKRKVEMSYIGG
jgi:cyclic pyranopterin phosphate synthase